MKKSLIIALGLVFILVLLFVIRFVFGGLEDSWVCENGAWVRHGNPSASQPDELCTEEGVIGGEKDEYGCFVAAGYQWCPSTGKCQRMWAEYCEEYKDQYKETVLEPCDAYAPGECPADCAICAPETAGGEFSCQNPGFCAERQMDAAGYQGIIDGIDSFEECVLAGNPVMESQPRQCQSGEQIFTEDLYSEEAKADLIRLAYPKTEDTVKSPLLISGEARGTWFFEGSFPVTLTNWDGLIIAEGVATATGEWMTEEFVPFNAILEFEADTTVSNRGSLILRKDNPSGLPENDDALEITVYLE